ALVPMLVAGLAADVGLVNLNDAAKPIGLVLRETGTDTIAHVERGFVRTEAHVAVDLQRTHSLLAGHHQVNDLEPVAQRLVRVLKDRSDQHGETIAASGSALRALPMEGSIGDGINVRVAAARATDDACRPPSRDQIRFAGVLVRKELVEL